MFICSNLLCHLAHDVKKSITNLELSILSDFSSIFSDALENARL